MEGHGELLFGGHRVSIRDGEKNSGNSGDGCTTL